MLLKIICSLSLLSYLVAGQAQVMDYAVYKGKKRIGTQKVTKEVLEINQVNYSIKSDVEFRIMGKKNMIFTVESTFDSGQLGHCLAMELMNNKTRHYGETARQENSYIYKDGSTVSSLFIDTPIEWTVSRMYFEEPLGITEIYAERHGQYLEIEHAGDGRYDLILPNDRKTTYLYADGVCQAVEINHWAASVRMEKI